MGESHRISVIIPTYGRPELLERAVRSAAEQTLPPAEIVIVDDNEPGSPARAETAELVAAMERSLGGRVPVRYTELAKNSGGAAARNAGVASSSGDLLAFLDDDDWWLPGKLEAQVSFFADTGTSPALVYTGRRIVDAAGELKRLRIPEHRGRMEDVLLRSNVIGTTSCALLPRTVFDEVGGFDPSLPARQDLDLWVRVARGRDIDFAADPLTVQTEHESGRVSRRFDAKARGLEMFLRKHRRAMAAVPGALAHNLFVLGRFYLKYGRPLRGRRNLLHSFLLHPSRSTLRLLLLGLPRPTRNGHEATSEDD
jgi:glycosyltransferase involved in cell wall biosynthesis